jgi:hypothetical protein
MKYGLGLACLLAALLGWSYSAQAAATDITSLETQFRTLPLEVRQWTGPLFWLHGDESPQRLGDYVRIVAESGNGSFTAESRPHKDWLGPGWFNDLSICLEAARNHGLKMWIFDEKWWPSQGVGGNVPAQYAAKQLEAVAVDVEGPALYEADGYSGPNYIAALIGRMDTDGKILGSTLIDAASLIQDGKLRWQVPQGRWKIMKFTHKQTPALGQNGQLSVDGASRDCVEWFIQTVYQPHYDRFKDDFGKIIPGFFYDEPETRGDWGTELNVVLAEWKVDWKKAYAAYKFQLAGEEQAAAHYQYRDAFAEAWGRTMYGGITDWCRQHDVMSIGHFMEHSSLYLRPDFCGGDMMRLQRYSSMGGIDAVFDQFVMGKRVVRDHPSWQTPKLASSISHVFGKADDLSMVEIFGARGQDLTYPEMKWWTNHMHVSGVNFHIPHSFNPRAPYDNDCPPYFYNGGYEPRYPLYRVYADYTSRLSAMLIGGRHVCPAALLFGGNAAQVGKMIPPEDMTSALQDAQYDCDWLPFDVLENQAKLVGNEIRLYQERYRVLIVPPVEVIPYGVLAAAKTFFEQGGIVVGYGFLPTRSATLGKTAADITGLTQAIWGDAAQPGLTACKSNTAGGRSYLLPEVPTAADITQALAKDAGIPPVVEVVQGETSGWLHVLHRAKADADIFLICNQNHQGDARQFTFRFRAPGMPECWDPMRGEITSIAHRRIDNQSVEVTLTMEPIESVVLVFRPDTVKRPARLDASIKPLREPIVLTRGQTPESLRIPQKPDQPEAGKPLTAGPVPNDPFVGTGQLVEPIQSDKVRIILEADDIAPEQAAAVIINGQYAGGFIGKPLRLEVTQYLKQGDNAIQILPFAPKQVRLAFYPK